MTPALDGETWVVVLNWNGRLDTLECLETLQSEPVNVLVVDNGSTDGSAEAIRSAYPNVVVVETGENLGYSGGNNIGIASALDLGASHVAVLNNDTLVTAGMFDALRDASHSLGERAALSPQIYRADGSDQPWFLGGAVDRDMGWPHHTFGSALAPAVGGIRISGVLTGCCIFASARVWQEVGLFDERYFLLFEDSDWSARAQRLGVLLRVVADARLQHKVSRSLQENSPLSVYYFVRNGLLYGHENAGGARVRWRFVREWMIGRSARDLRADFSSASIHLAFARLAGFSHFLVGRFGPAPRFIWQLDRRSRSATTLGQ